MKGKQFDNLPRVVQRELYRLVQAEVMAARQGDLDSHITCRLLWCELYLAAGGSASPAFSLLMARNGDATPDATTPRDTWRARLRERPLVAVVRRRRVDWHDSAGGKHTHYSETLACGHTLTMWYMLPGEKFARRHRCKECGDARIAARGREVERQLFLVKREGAR